MVIQACVTELCYVDLRVTTRQDTVGSCVNIGSVAIVGGNRDNKFYIKYIKPLSIMKFLNFEIYIIFYDLTGIWFLKMN